MLLNPGIAFPLNHLATLPADRPGDSAAVPQPLIRRIDNRLTGFGGQIAPNYSDKLAAWQSLFKKNRRSAHLALRIDH